MFRHSAIYIRSDRGIRSPADLKGRRIGVPEYQMSAALWARGMIHDEHHARYDEMRWVRADSRIPAAKRVREFGAAVGRFLRGLDRRVVIIGSGGASFSPP